MSTRDRLSRLTADLLVPVAPVVAPPAAAPDPGPAAPGAPAAAALPASPATGGMAEPPPVETRFPGVTPRQAGRKTGPGEMLAFRGQMLAAEGEVTRLRDALQQFDGSLPTKKLDPRLVLPSRWANRHEASFATADFIRFNRAYVQPLTDWGIFRNDINPVSRCNLVPMVDAPPWVSRMRNIASGSRHVFFERTFVAGPEPCTPGVYAE